MATRNNSGFATADKTQSSLIAPSRYDVTTRNPLFGLAAGLISSILCFEHCRRLGSPMAGYSVDAGKGEGDRKVKTRYSACATIDKKSRQVALYMRLPNVFQP